MQQVQLESQSKIFKVPHLNLRHLPSLNSLCSSCTITKWVGNHQLSTLKRSQVPRTLMIRVR